jgi:YHS domain-containing protein
MASMARDIVCDMTVNEEDAKKKGLISQYKDKSFYFCGKACKTEFDGNPERFAAEKPIDLYAGGNGQRPPGASLHHA